jgi:hypothetical protein
MSARSEITASTFEARPCSPVFGDCLTDETGEWEGIGLPCTVAGWVIVKRISLAAGGVGGVEEARGRERVGGARVEADEELHVLLERAAKLMVKAGYRSYSVTVKVAGKEKRYGLMESSFYLDMVMKRRNPPQK